MTIDATNDPLEWGSHVAPLMACIATNKPGSILELGIGHFSTPLLHVVCQASRKRLISVEADEKWFAEFSDHYADAGHVFMCGKYDDLVPSLAKERWSVCLIDNSPGGNRRSEDLKALLPSSEYVVVHDYHKDNEEVIGRWIGSVKYRRVCARYQPPTLVSSYWNPIPEGLFKL